MKKIYFLLSAVLLLGTFASWAQDLSFTIWPEASGTFQIYYSTYNAPSGSCVFVDWGDGRYNYPKAETGSDPSKLISGTVTKGKPIYIYSDYIDAIYIVTQSQAILCNENNPQLQYFYYFKDNLSPQNLEAFYLSLKDRSSKSNWGELHLTMESNVANISNNIKKSNAFITIDKKWAICSKKAWTGSSSARIYWELNEANCKSNLIPAIEITTPTTANIELRLGMTPDQSLPWHSITSKVRIIDGNNNNTSEFIYRYTTESDFWNNSTKHSLKGGKIKIYGAQVSHLSTSGISSLNFNGTTNMRYLRIDNSSNLNSLPGLNENKLLEYVKLYKTGFTSLDLSPLSNLKTLDLYYNYELKYLYYNTSNLKTLYVSGCSKLDIGVLNVLKNSKKLTKISVGSMGWDACTLDEIYRNLYSPAPSGAQIYVEDICESNNFNDYEGSNKTIATNKGWKVMLEYNCGAEKQLTGDGGGCKPDVVTCLLPLNRATNVSVNGVQLRFGFGANTSQYQLKWGKNFNQFSNVTSYKTTGGKTGFSNSIISELDYNTTYYWQVNVKNENDNERIGEIWSFTTEADPKPAVATCLVPTINGNSAVLSITFGANTEEYEVRWGKNGSSLTSTSSWKSAVGMSSRDYTIANLDYSTKYYFQINTRNKQGDVTNSSIWNFTTGAVPKPDAVTNNAPSNKATGIKNGDELKWTFGANTNEYKLLLGTSSTPSDVAVSYTSTLATSYTLSNLKYSTKYYWQVIAKNATGETKGAIWSFTTADAPAQAPDAVTNNAPSNKATGIKNGDELKWTFGANTSEYQLMLGTSSTPSDVAVSYTSTLASSYTLSGLKYSTKYYWQVIAKNATGETKGAIWSFTTADAPAQAPDAVTNTAPQNEATNIENGMFLSWTFGNNTSEYQLMMGTSNPPSNEMLPYTNTLVTSYTLSGLENNTTYYWQINTKNAEGTTAGSIWSFTTTPKTGINKAEASEAIKVYANGNELHLITSSNEAALVNVYNLTGQVVMKGKTNGSTHTILNASTLCNGIYMVSIIQNNKVAVSRKVYIQKR